MAHPFELIVWTQSRFFNAGIFFFIDIIGLWSIHRSLKAIQAYYLYRLASLGRPVPIARSRLPLFSGELLFGVTRAGSMFILANTVAIVLAFVGTLGVNGETRPVWIPLHLTNTTTLHGGYASWDPSTNFQSATATCRTDADDRIAYWPVAFNLTQSQLNSNPRHTELVPLNSTCQAQSPEFSPLVTAQCINITEKGCNIYETRPDVEIDVMLSPSTIKQWNNYTTEYNFSTHAAHLFFKERKRDFDLLHGSQGTAFVISKPLEEITLVFLTNGYSDSLFVSVGMMRKTNDSFAILNLSLPARLSPASIFSEDVNFLKMFRTEWFDTRTNIPSKNMPELADFLFVRGFGSAPFRKQAFKPVLKDVTTIEIYAAIIYFLLIFALIVLFFTRELLICISARRKGVAFDEVFETDFNQLSKNLRRAIESENDLVYSGAPALLGVHVDYKGISRMATSSSQFSSTTSTEKESCNSFLKE